jgi:AcrR family transcriptional regulator
MSAVTADPTIRRQVLATARRLVARDRAVSVERIAAEAGVSRATFYRHFGSRHALLRDLELDPVPAARERILAAGAEMLVRHPLAELSMEDLAVAAGVSRATLYRIVPGKAALLSALINAYAPFDEMLALLARHPDEPPDTLLPRLLRTAARSAWRRQGIVRALLLEATSGSPTAIAGVRATLQRAMGILAGYLSTQMAAGRLRPMHPMLALQALMGPVVFPVLTREVAGRVLGFTLDVEESADELSAAILDGLLPVAR